MKARVFFTPLASLLAALVLYAAVVGIGRAEDPPPTPDPAPVEVTVEGKTAAQWHAVAARYLNRTRSLAVAIRFDPETSTAINLACVVYGHCSELWRKARCESQLYRYAANRHSSARGLFQFLTTPNGGTWGSTPYGRFSVYDPYANALAAGWMHARGRGGEWVCQ